MICNIKQFQSKNSITINEDGSFAGKAAINREDGPLLK